MTNTMQRTSVDAIRVRIMDNLYSAMERVENDDYSYPETVGEVRAYRRVLALFPSSDPVRQMADAADAILAYLAFDEVAEHIDDIRALKDALVTGGERD